VQKALTYAGVILALWSAPLWAQGKGKEKQDLTVRSVEGTVTDAEGRPVEGGVVHLKNTKTLQIRSFITRAEGAYSFHGLSTNVDYELRAEYQGAASDTRTLSVFDPRRKAVIHLKLNSRK
jgi:hypothetical protein